MLLFSVLVAGSFSFGKLIANDIAPQALTALRFAIGSVFMGALALAMGQVHRATFNAPWRYLAMGSAMAVYFVLMFKGLQTSGAVSITAVFTLTPAMSAVFGWLLLRQVTTPAIALALIVGAMGAIWVIFRADLDLLLAFDVGRGEIIFFFGCIAHAIYAPLVPRLNRGEGPVAFTAGMLIGGTLILMVIAAGDLMAVNWSELPARFWYVLAYLSLLTTSITFFLVQYAAMRLPASKVMAYTYFTPSVVILWEGALGHGWPSPNILVGIGATILALLMLLRVN